MKTNPFVRPAGALALLAFMLAAPPSRAWWIFGCRGAGCVARDQVKERAGQEFDALREKVEREHKDSEHLDLYVTQIRETEKRFKSQADAVLKKERYAQWEFRYIGERVTHVIIPTIEKAVEAAAMMPAADAAVAFKLAASEGGDSDILHRATFARVNRAEIEQSAEQNENPVPADGTAGPVDTAAENNGPAAQTGESTDAAGLGDRWKRRHADREGGGSRNDYVFGGKKPTAEELVAASDVVRLAEASANYVKNDAGPGGNPGDGNPGGGNPTPGEGNTPPGDGNTSPGNGNTSPGGGNTSPATPGDGTGSVRPRPRPSRPGVPSGGFIDSITSPAGVSQLYAMNGIRSLENRDFRGALSSAQRALALDPSNRRAMEVYQTAKGRGDAAGLGAAGIQAARADAAALSAFAGVPAAAGAPSSPGFSAVASPGAVRAATEQARAGAINAMKLGDPAGALEILSKALGNDPNNPALLNLRAQTYGRLGRWEEAYKDASAGLALVPGNMALLTTKALTENRTRRWRDALATSERMIAADPRSPWGYANRAHAWAGLGNREAMLSDINRAAALDPRFQQAAADAALLQLPSDGDVMFLFPGESPKGAAQAPAPAPAGRGKSFGVVVGAGIVGGLLLALGLLSTVLAPLKNTVVSVFTRARRTGPATDTAVATAQPASAAGNVGGLIRGQYEISRQIGAGGMGMVYEGTDRSLGRRVAIKKMREELRVNARERDRFVIEAKTVASLHHPNIVDIYAIAEEGEDVYLVFEYVDGKTVHDLVQGAGRLDPAESVRLTRAMGEALTYAHAHGVIHRDMKPSNVMVTAAGQVKVMDFGIARMAKDALTRYSMTNTVVGTPPYMAPEQEQGVVRKESDVYSLAICSYEMLTGKMPFIGIGAGMLMNKINMSYIPPSRAIAGLPEALDEVFLKAFQADPDRRYRTPSEFVTALASAAGGARKTA